MKEYDRVELTVADNLPEYPIITVKEEDLKVIWEYPD